MTIQQIMEGVLGQAGVLFVMLLILVTGWRGYWVYGRYYEEQRARIEALERRLDRALGAAESGTGLATRAVRQAEGRRSERSG